MSRRIPPRGEGVHPLRLALFARPEDPVRVGAPFEVAVDLSCAHGCEGKFVSLVVDDPSHTTRTERIALSSHPIPLALTAPKAPGPHTWRLSIAASAADDHAHEPASLTLTIEVIPHTASIAVWELPDAALAGQSFKLKVGAKSTAGRVLAGRTIEIRDASGNLAGHAVLGEGPWPGTEALQWGEAEVAASAVPGTMALTAEVSARSDQSPDELPHDTVPCGFTVNVAPPPRHTVTVHIIEEASGLSVADALVRIGAFRATTGPDGMAKLKVPPGPAEIVVWKTGYDAPEHPIDISEDATISISAKVVPEEDPDAHWKA